MRAPLRVTALLGVALVLCACPKGDGGPTDDTNPGGDGGDVTQAPDEGPFATIDWPADGSSHNTVRLDVRGRARDVGPLYVNSDPVEVAEDGTWVVDVELPEGEGEIRLVSTSPQDLSADPELHDAARVTIDLRAPLIRLTSLPGNEHPTRPHVQVVGADAELEGTVEDPWPGTIDSLTLDGVETSLVDDTFRARLAIAEDGDHTAELVLRDAAGNSTRLSVPLVRDTTAPVVRIDENKPQPGREVRMIRGFVVDANPLALHVDGERVAVDQDGGFELERVVEDGAPLQLVGEDAAGNLSDEVLVEAH